MLILLIGSDVRLNYAPLAQLAEQLTLNQWVPGSSPGGCTLEKPGISHQSDVRGLFVFRGAIRDPLQNPSDGRREGADELAE